MPIELEGYTRSIAQLQSLKEIVNRLSDQDYDSFKRSENKKRQLRQFVRTMNMYYGVIFARGSEQTEYGVQIYSPSLSEDAEKSSGIVLVERKITDGKFETRFERAKFDDFLIDVRSYIEINGDLHRKRTKPRGI
ncbi:MAG: hypothetical protein JRN67_09855 [Nitrososphaerota archaeon]|nr:hypothetical protein [Nitrososphaerota archaeon]